MAFFTFWNFATVLFSSLIAMAAAWSMLRLMDRANTKVVTDTRNHGWNDALTAIKSDPVAASIYYGLRCAGVCILVGLVFSRSI